LRYSNAFFWKSSAVPSFSTSNAFATFTTCEKSNAANEA